MEKSKSGLMIGLGVLLLLAVGFMSYSLGMKQGASTMHTGMMNSNMDHSQMTMEQMSEGLQGLEGDAFDKAFLEMMIVHHQGAVDMAKEIPVHAKHEELKKLGAEITSTQEKEIEMMKGWLKTWGYDQESNIGGMDHSGMKM